MLTETNANAVAASIHHGSQAQRPRTRWPGKLAKNIITDDLEERRSGRDREDGQDPEPAWQRRPERRQSRRRAVLELNDAEGPAGEDDGAEQRDRVVGPPHCDQPGEPNAQHHEQGVSQPHDAVASRPEPQGHALQRERQGCAGPAAFHDECRRGSRPRASPHLRQALSARQTVDRDDEVLRAQPGRSAAKPGRTIWIGVLSHRQR